MPAMRQLRTAFLAAASCAAFGCQQPQSQQHESTNAANAGQRQVVPEIPLPAPEPPLGREQLLLAVIHAASDFAAGADDAKAQHALAGKKFEFRIRFGCEPPPGPAGAYGWTFDASTGALKVRATPTLSSDDVPVKSVAGDAFETVEGFWIRKPWLLGATCPRRDPASQPAPEGQLQAVGIAQFFTATGPRTLRRSGRPYEATKKLETGDESKGGFDLVLTGRLVALPDGRVIACTWTSADEQPSCIISVEFGKVSIERADTHEQLAQWGAG
jgi:hypothetical protein